jgi:NADPH:quinone reductase-like Zn-dependent oxidoreductase
MKAMCLRSELGVRSLAPAELPIPVPRPAEVLVRVHATGVIHTELGWYPTTHTPEGGARENAVPGHEFSGVVARVGADAGEFQEGDEVFGMNDWFADGAVAEYCLAAVSGVARKPSTLSHAEAASDPISALTAWQGLHDRAALRAGERVLIHGAAGAVGTFALQFAHRAGAQIFATASARDADFVRDLGAAQVIDYRSQKFEEHVGKVDVVFDAVGGEVLTRSWNVLAPGGRLVTIASASEGADDERTKAAFFIVEANREQLSQIAQLLDASELRTFVAGTFPLAEAAAAYARPERQDWQHGKVVITINSDASASQTSK